MKTYVGYRRSANAFVLEAGTSTPLSPRLDLQQLSPYGFGWGYKGVAPAQLALAICADLTDDDRALRVYERFMMRVVERLDRDNGWCLTAGSLLKHIEEIEQEIEHEHATP